MLRIFEKVHHYELNACSTVEVKLYRMGGFELRLLCAPQRERTLDIHFRRSWCGRGGRISCLVKVVIGKDVLGSARAHTTVRSVSGSFAIPEVCLTCVRCLLCMIYVKSTQCVYNTKHLENH